ncbi:MAG: hypothetical protein ACK56I_06780, partial [bacterium]
MVVLGDIGGTPRDALPSDSLFAHLGHRTAILGPWPQRAKSAWGRWSRAHAQTIVPLLDYSPANEQGDP